MPAFTVVIPTRRRPELLREAVASVLAQTVGDLELVIVDDDPDGGAEVPTDDPRVRLVRSGGGGAAGARNVGVAAATGDAIAFLDDDDTWTTERLAFAVEGLARAPVAVCWQAPSGRRLDGRVHDAILDATIPSLGATAILRRAWIPLDTTYRSCEDLVWWLDTSAEHEVATVCRQGLVVGRHDGDRSGYGAEQRNRDSIRLMEERADWFATHPRAAAFRWKAIGLRRQQLGDRAAARQAFLRALRLRPSAADAAHLLRSFRPGG